MTKESSSFWADIKKYEDMLANDPKSYCFTLLSELYRKLGLLDDAINVAKRGIDTHPEYIGGHMAVGRAYFEKGMKEESINALEKVVQATPENILAQKLLSQMYIDRGDIESAINALKVIELLSPEDIECRLMLEALKKPAAKDDVMADCRADASSVSGSEVDSDGEGFVFIDEVPDIEQAEEWSNGVHEIPEAGIFHEKGPLATATLAELYVSQGFLDQAINVYRELLENEPDNWGFKERLDQLSCPESGSNLESTGYAAEFVEENTEYNTPEESYSIEKENNFVSVAGNADGIIVTLECWLENIRRGRYGAATDTERYC